MAIDGLIVRAHDQAPKTDLAGHPGIKALELIRPSAKGALHLKVILDEIEPGGKIEPHFHELTPACDHAYYVISGDIIASVGGQTERVGPDTLIYCLSNVVHSIKNVGDSPAKMLRIGAAASGDTKGKLVFVRD